MRKKLYYLFFVLATIMFASCDSSKVEYIPVSLDSDSRSWSFMNQKGEVVLEGEYESCPSYVKDGVFTVKEGDTYTLYKFDTKKSKVILEDLVYVGTPQDGILPVCHKDNRIDIVKVSGDIVFTLDVIDGQTVYSCDNSFQNGYLIVTTMNSEGKSFMAAVDTKGRCVIKPRYDYLANIGKNLFAGRKIGDDKVIVFNEKEEKISTWKSDMDIDVNTKSDKYIAVRKNDRICIYDLNGEEIVKCKEKVRSIVEILDDCYIYLGEEGTGVMTFDGEDILRAKNFSVSSFDEGFISRRSYEDKIQVWNKNGEEVSIKDEWDWAFQIPGFGVIGVDGNEFSLLDESFEEKDSKNRFYSIGSISAGYSERVYSDFFDYNAVTSVIENLLSGELNNKKMMPGFALADCEAINDDMINNSGQYSERMTIDYMNSVRFGISLTAYFDGYVKTPFYKTREVVRTYGFYRYRDTERYIDHYEKNDSAKIIGVAVTVRVPSDKNEEMMNKIKSVMDSKFKGKLNYEYSESDKDILIRFDKGNVLINISYWYGQDQEEVIDEVPVEEVVVEDAEEMAPIEEAVW